MKKAEKGVKGLTRREFLYRSGAGMAGMALAGVPRFSFGAKKYGGQIRIAARTMERSWTAGMSSTRLIGS